MTDQEIGVIVVGAGNMGGKWFNLAQEHPRTNVVAVVDLDLERARGVVERENSSAGILITSDLQEALRHSDAHWLINTTVPAAHYEVCAAAMWAGLDVVTEKPVTETTAQGLRLLALSQLTGKLMVTSQSRRLLPQVRAMAAARAQIGNPELVTCQFNRAPHFGGFREEMDHPLLLDMGIHPFDLARELIQADPVSVFCAETNPSWSWYRGDAAASAIFDMGQGKQFTYSASWCSPGAETSWNGAWRLSGPHGTLLWDGDHDPLVGIAEQPPEPVPYTDNRRAGIAAAFDESVDYYRRGVIPSGEIHQNLASLAMVEAAIRSSREQRVVTLEEIWGEAREQAIATEPNGEVRGILSAWGYHSTLPFDVPPHLRKTISHA